MGQSAAQKLFKFGVLHNHLRFLHLEGNIDMAEFPGMGTFVADIVKTAAGGRGAAGKKRSSSTRKKGGAGAANVQPAHHKKLDTLRITLFDFKKEVDDQTSTLGQAWPAGGSGGGGKKKGVRGGVKGGRVKKKGAKGAASGSNPMNALAFVKSIFGMGGDRKGAGKKRPPTKRAAAMKRGKKGGDDSNMNPEAKR